MNFFTNYFENKIETHLNESPEGYDDENVVPMHKYVENLPYEELFSHTGKHSNEELAKRLNDVATGPHRSTVREKAYKILATKFAGVGGHAESIRKDVHENPNEYTARMVSHVLASTKDNEDVAKTLKNMSPSHYFYRSPLAFEDSKIGGRLYDKNSYETIKNSDAKHKDLILGHTEFWNRHHKEGN